MASPSMTSRLTPTASPPLGPSTLRSPHESTSSRQLSSCSVAPSASRSASPLMTSNPMPPPLPRSQSLSLNQSSSESAEKPTVSSSSLQARADPEIEIRSSQEKPAKQPKSSIVAEQPIHANVSSPSKPLLRPTSPVDQTLTIIRL